MRITQAKVDAGDVTRLDYFQAQSLVKNSEAELAGLFPLLENNKISLLILIGRQPTEFKKITFAFPEVYKPELDLFIGTPQDIIRRRPDIRQAEKQLAAQSALIGFAITDLYPHLSLFGSVGTATGTSNGTHFSDLFNGDTSTWTGGLSLEWNIFNYGRLKSNIRLQDAIFQEQLESYRQLILNAQSEVEQSINTYIYSCRQIGFYREASNASEEAVKIASEQYKDGLIEYNTVIQNLQTLTNQEDKLIQSKGDAINGIISTYKALGGGYQNLIAQDQQIKPSSKEEMLKRIDYWEGQLSSVDKDKKPGLIFYNFKVLC